MAKKTKLTIEFESPQLRQMFRGWLLDGGGEQDFYEAYQSRNPERGIEIDYDDEESLNVTTYGITVD